VTNLLSPTPDDLDHARRLVDGFSDADRYALHYIGATLNRVAEGDLDSSSLRGAIAMYRVVAEVKP
jgi:hypothetical protein